MDGRTDGRMDGALIPGLSIDIISYKGCKSYNTMKFDLLFIHLIKKSMLFGKPMSLLLQVIVISDDRFSIN